MSDLARCETCKHWKFDKPDWEFDDIKFGECKRIMMRSSIVDAALIEAEVSDQFSNDGDRIAHDAIAKAKAIAVDGSGYYAALRTAPDFGCVLHEAGA